MIPNTYYWLTGRISLKNMNLHTTIVTVAGAAWFGSDRWQSPIYSIFMKKWVYSLYFSCFGITQWTLSLSKASPMPVQWFCPIKNLMNGITQAKWDLLSKIYWNKLCPISASIYSRTILSFFLKFLNKNLWYWSWLWFESVCSSLRRYICLLYKVSCRISSSWVLWAALLSTPIYFWNVETRKSDT